MPSKRPIERFNDIIYNIDAIVRYTAGMSREAFLADQKTVDATQHCLLRITEAARKLGKLAERAAPDQPWKAIRDLGNRLRHEYDLIEKDRIWQIVCDDLASLRAACERSIKRMHEGLDRLPDKDAERHRKQ